MTHTERIKQNIWKLYMLRAIRSFAILLPIISLFFIERGLEQHEIFLLQALFGLVFLILEIPSGYFADRFGRRNALILAAVFWALGDLAFANAYGFWELFRAEFLLAISASLFSGADEAMMHDTLRDLGKKERYLKHDKNIFIVYVLAEGVAAIIGGILITYHSYATLWFIQASISALAIPLALSLREPNTHEGRALESVTKEVGYIFKQPGLFGFFILYASAFVTTLMMVWFSQPYFIGLGVNEASLGFIWATYLVLSALAAQLTPYLERRFGLYAIASALAFTPVIVYGALAFLPSGLWLLTVAAWFWIQRGIQTPVMRTIIQQQAEETNRATTLSVGQAIARLVFLLSPILGSVALWGSYEMAFLATGITLSVLGLIGLTWWRLAR